MFEKIVSCLKFRNLKVLRKFSKFASINYPKKYKFIPIIPFAHCAPCTQYHHLHRKFLHPLISNCNLRRARALHFQRSRPPIPLLRLHPCRRVPRCTLYAPHPFSQSDTYLQGLSKLVLLVLCPFEASTSWILFVLVKSTDQDPPTLVALHTASRRYVTGHNRTYIIDTPSSFF